PPKQIRCRSEVDGASSTPSRRVVPARHHGPEPRELGDGARERNQNCVLVRRRRGFRLLVWWRPTQRRSDGAWKDGVWRELDCRVEAKTEWLPVPERLRHDQEELAETEA